MLDELLTKGAIDGVYDEKDENLRIEKLLGKRVLRDTESKSFSERTGDSNYNYVDCLENYKPENGYQQTFLITRALNRIHKSAGINPPNLKHPLQKRKFFVIDKRVEPAVDEYFQQVVRPRQTLLDSEALALEQLRIAHGLEKKALTQLPMDNKEADKVFDMLEKQVFGDQVLRGVPGGDGGGFPPGAGGGQPPGGAPGAGGGFPPGGRPYGHNDGSEDESKEDDDEYDDEEDNESGTWADPSNSMADLPQGLGERAQLQQINNVLGYYIGQRRKKNEQPYQEPKPRPEPQPQPNVNPNKNRNPFADLSLQGQGNRGNDTMPYQQPEYPDVTMQTVQSEPQPRPNRRRRRRRRFNASVYTNPEDRGDDEGDGGFGGNGGGYGDRDQSAYFSLSSGYNYKDAANLPRQEVPVKYQVDPLRDAVQKDQQKKKEVEQEIQNQIQPAVKGKGKYNFQDVSNLSMKPEEKRAEKRKQVMEQYNKARELEERARQQRAAEDERIQIQPVVSQPYLSKSSKSTSSTGSRFQKQQQKLQELFNNINTIEVPQELFDQSQMIQQQQQEQYQKQPQNILTDQFFNEQVDNRKRDDEEHRFEYEAGLRFELEKLRDYVNLTNDQSLQDEYTRMYFQLKNQMFPIYTNFIDMRQKQFAKQEELERKLLQQPNDLNLQQQFIDVVNERIGYEQQAQGLFDEMRVAINNFKGEVTDFHNQQVMNKVQEDILQDQIRADQAADMAMQEQFVQQQPQRPNIQPNSRLGKIREEKKKQLLQDQRFQADVTIASNADSEKQPQIFNEGLAHLSDKKLTKFGQYLVETNITPQQIAEMDPQEAFQMEQDFDKYKGFWNYLKYFNQLIRNTDVNSQLGEVIIPYSERLKNERSDIERYRIAQEAISLIKDYNYQFKVQQIKGILKKTTTAKAKRSEKLVAPLLNQEDLQSQQSSKGKQKREYDIQKEFQSDLIQQQNQALQDAAEDKRAQQQNEVWKQYQQQQKQKLGGMINEQKRQDQLYRQGQEERKRALLEEQELQHQQRQQQLLQDEQRKALIRQQFEEQNKPVPQQYEEEKVSKEQKKIEQIEEKKKSKKKKKNKKLTAEQIDKMLGLQDLKFSPIKAKESNAKERSPTPSVITELSSRSRRGHGAKKHVKHPRGALEQMAGFQGLALGRHRNRRRGGNQ